MRLIGFVFFFVFTVLALAEVPEHLYLKAAPPIELPNSAKYMVYLETNANPVGTRSAKPFWIEHLEIPLSFLQEDKGQRLDQRIHESMVFTNENGEKTVRWILNPEDTAYGEQLVEYLKSKGLNSEKKRYFIGYSTSSRSCIVQDPVTGTTFSIKSSTNQTSGKWNDKKETVRAARAGRVMSDHITKSNKLNENQTLKIVSEPLAYYMAGVDQGIVVRQYDHFLAKSQDRKLVPVFAFTHRADYYAEKAGFEGPVQDFAKETLIKMGGAVTAELFLNYGIVYNSPHGQNFLVEVDKYEKPTGKMFARDYADSHLFEPIFKLSSHGRSALRHYRTFTSSNNEILTDYARLAFGPYHDGTGKKPGWITDSSVLQSQFRTSLHERLLKTLALSQPGAVVKSSSWESSYFTETIGLNENDALKKWLEAPVYSAAQFAARAPKVVPIRSSPRPQPSPAAVRSCRVLLTGA